MDLALYFLAGVDLAGRGGVEGRVQFVLERVGSADQDFLFVVHSIARLIFAGDLHATAGAHRGVVK